LTQFELSKAIFDNFYVKLTKRRKNTILPEKIRKRLIKEEKFFFLFLIQHLEKF